MDWNRAFGFKRWADERTCRALERVDAQAHAPLYAFALQQLNHMVLVDELFRSRLEGSAAPHTATNSEIVPRLDVLTQRLRASGRWYQEAIAAVGETQRPVTFRFADGQAGRMSVEEMLLHVLTHGSYHRGNIARALDETGVAHPVDGYAAFLHEQEPARRDSGPDADFS